MPASILHENFYVTVAQVVPVLILALVADNRNAAQARSSAAILTALALAVLAEATALTAIYRGAPAAFSPWIVAVALVVLTAVLLAPYVRAHFSAVAQPIASRIPRRWQLVMGRAAIALLGFLIPTGFEWTLATTVAYEAVWCLILPFEIRYWQQILLGQVDPDKEWADVLRKAALQKANQERLRSEQSQKATGEDN